VISPGITAIVIAVLVALAFGGGFALSEWRTSLPQIKRLENAKNWECKATLIYNPRQESR
jgi:hypothetical protein